MLTLAFCHLLSTTYSHVLVLLEDGLKSLESKLTQRDQGIERLQEEKMRPKMNLKEAVARASHERFMLPDGSLAIFAAISCHIFAFYPSIVNTIGAFHGLTTSRTKLTNTINMNQLEMNRPYLLCISETLHIDIALMC